MAERMVLGVDFSGGKGDDHVGKTWFTKGWFDGATLIISDCRPVSRDGLRALLKGLPSDSVAAMDFPFGVPMEFIQYLGIDTTDMPTVDMPTVWRSILSDGKDVAWFEAKCREAFKELGYESKRTGDEYYPESKSPLNLRMFRMTFHGMSMLGKLWNETNCQVPPLQQEERNGLTLLEVMPGAALKAFGLPFTGYKDGKGNTVLQEKRKARKKILGELDGASQIQLEMPDEIRNICIDNRGGDALDSLVAAVVAAKWAKNESDFLVPSDEVVDTLKRNKRNKRRASQQAMGKSKIEVARREGWIYTPLSN